MFLSGGVQAKRLWYHSVRNFGGKEKAIIIRLTSVKTIEKITKSMKMVASSKMNADMRRLRAGQRFGISAVDMMFKTDLYMQRKMANEIDNPTEILVPISSDKGLCGSINSGVARYLREYIGSDMSRFSIFAIGEKGANAFRRPYKSIFNHCVTQMTYPINYSLTMALSDRITRLSKEKNADSVVIFYNQFVNAMTFQITRVELMSLKRFSNAMKFQRLYEMERPDATTAIPALYELYLSANLYHAQLHNAASEQSSRMVSMDNASKNAGEIVERLTLEYNKARQQSITMELCEIISGAESM
jgi:F-type H+-transporting ATPase subunit gamma